MNYELLFYILTSFVTRNIPNIILYKVIVYNAAIGVNFPFLKKIG